MKITDQPSDFGTLVSSSYGFFKDLFKPLVWVIVAQYLVLFGVGVGTALLMFLAVQFLGKSAAVFLGMIVGVLFLFVIAYFISAQFARAYGVMWNEANFINQTWQIAKARYLRVAGFMVVIALLFTAIALVLFLVNMLIGMIFKSGIIIGLLALASILFMVYLGVRLYLCIPLLVVFDQGIFQALREGFAATAERFWRTFGVILLVVGVPSLGLMGLQLLFSGHSVVLAIINFIISLLGNFAIMVLTISTIYVLFNDYQLRDNPAVPIESSKNT